MPRRACLGLLLLASLALATPAPAHVGGSAHEPPTAARPSSAPVAALAAWIAFGALATGLGVGRRRRHVMAGLVSAALAVFAVEAAVHSVHHLGSDHDARECRVAAAASQVGGTPEQPPSVAPVPGSRETVALVSAVEPRGSDLRPDRGRAPPSAT